MPKILVDCGNCGPDYSAIRQMVLANFDAIVLQTHGLEDTLDVLANRDVALVTVNRKLDRDYTDGMEVLRGIKADPRFASIPVMLVTNYDEHQLAAEQEGAVRGFGKLTVRDPKTIDLLRPYLGAPKAAPGIDLMPSWLWLTLAIVIGLVAGFLFGAQPSVNGQLSRQLAHPLQASIISFGTGFVILVVLAAAGGVFPPRFNVPLSELPWWCWGGGAIGVLSVTASLIFVPRIGSLPWNATIITGQLAAAILLDQYGWLGNSREPLTITRAIGATFLIAGVVIIFWAKGAPTPASSSPARLSNAVENVD